MNLSIAILGASGIAASHVASLRKIDGVDVRVVCSRSPDLARKFADANRIPIATDDVSRALAEVDAVVIATEPSRHAELAIHVLEHGKHVLLEKPVDADLDAGAALARRAATTNRVVSVVSQKRFDPVLVRMEENFRKFAGPAMIDLKAFWPRTSAYYAAGSGWRRTGSDFFVNQAIHWLDVLNWFFGEPCEVHAIAVAGRPETSCTDRATAALRYADGSLASIAGGSFAQSETPDTFAIRCADGTLDYQTLNRTPQSIRRIFRTRTLRNARSPTLLDRQARDFIDAIRDGRSPTTTLDQALGALRLGLALSNRLQFSGSHDIGTDAPPTSEFP